MKRIVRISVTMHVTVRPEHGNPVQKGLSHAVQHRYETCHAKSAASAVEDRVPYIPPFDVIKNATSISAIKGELRVTLSYDDLIGIIKQLLIGITVDEAWYLNQYEDVAHAISAGEFRSARAHFVEHGYIEGRLPGPIAVDEHWYLDQYPDVAESVRRGAELSAQAHFDRDGYREGRLPFPV